MKFPDFYLYVSEVREVPNQSLMTSWGLELLKKLGKFWIVLDLNHIVVQSQICVLG